MNKWDIRFIEKARLYASWSKDPSTKVGCVIVDPKTNTEVAGGFNGFPRKVAEEAPRTEGSMILRAMQPKTLDPERWARPTKYLYVEHAERNAIYNAARLGRATEGCWAYLSWDPTQSICTDCARALIQAGITTVIGPGDTVQGRLDLDEDEGWRLECGTAMDMMTEAGLEVRTIDARLSTGGES